jgi:hypothetical protein
MKYRLFFGILTIYDYQRTMTVIGIVPTIENEKALRFSAFFYNY